MNTALSVRNLTVRYDGNPVVSDLSFTVDRGESVALVGESGSGKSTILKAVLGLAPPWEGSIEVFGQPRGHRPDRGVARQCQMVFQDPYGSLHPRKNVDTALSEPLVIHGLDKRDARIADVLEAVDLDTRFRYRYPHQLSGGQRQRVAIARALILEPSMLLLDEPTSALDVSVQAGILNLLKRLRDERGLSYLLVTHNLPVVGFLCDRMAVMQRGRIVEVAATDVLRSGAFVADYSRELYAASLVGETDGER